MPVELLPIDQTAMLPALEQFEREYESVVCPVCRQEKWANSPFCRDCSIKLQRANLMWGMASLARDHGRDWMKWEPAVLRNFWSHYDTCRDFLICTKDQKFTRKRNHDEEDYDIG
jgi:hypothetical protein